MESKTRRLRQAGAALNELLISLFVIVPLIIGGVSLLVIAVRTTQLRAIVIDAAHWSIPGKNVKEIEDKVLDGAQAMGLRLVRDDICVSESGEECFGPSVDIRCGSYFTLEATLNLNLPLFRAVSYPLTVETRSRADSCTDSGSGNSQVAGGGTSGTGVWIGKCPKKGCKSK